MIANVSRRLRLLLTGLALCAVATIVAVALLVVAPDHSPGTSEFTVSETTLPYWVGGQDDTCRTATRTAVPTTVTSCVVVRTSVVRTSDVLAPVVVRLLDTRSSTAEAAQ